MKIQVVTVATHPSVQVSRFMKSCIKFGFWPVVLGFHRSYNGSQGRYAYYNEWFSDKRHLDGVTHILITDASDVLFAGTLDEIGEAYLRSGKRVLVAGERNCWPKPELAAQYPLCDFPYRFLNGGGLIGPVDDIITICSHLPVGEENDQLTLTNMFLHGSFGISIDHECRIWQCLLNRDNELDFGAQRIYNTRTCTHPLTFHGNGLADMSDVLFHPYCAI